MNIDEREPRQLTAAEISTLRSQGCMAEDWQSVTVSGTFAAERVVGVSFGGRVSIGDMGSVVEVRHLGCAMPSSIVRATLRDVVIGDSPYIQDVGYLSDYVIGDRFVAMSCGRIVGGRGKHSFGVGTRVSVVNEGGGREVALSASLTSNIAYCVAMHRYVEGLAEGYERLVESERQAARAEIGDDVTICGTVSIEGVRMASETVVDGAQRLTNGTILCAPMQTTAVTDGVTATDFIFAEGASVSGGAKLHRCFIGQCATVGGGFVGEDLLAFANSQLLCGEAVAVMAGPYTVSHHKSSLLIAAAYSFYNAGSATNASNHHYRLGPIQQGVYGRGVKTGSGAYVLEPCNIGDFTMVVGHHRTHPDTAAWPFSVLCEREGESHLMVAQNLRTMGIFRDAMKWKNRDKRRTAKADVVSFDVLNPLTVSKMMEAVRKIETLPASNGEYLIEGGLRIRRGLLPRAAKAYRAAIDSYLAKAYAHDGGRSEGLECEWADAGGLVAPVSEVRAIESSIAKGEYASVADIAAAFAALGERAKELAMRWSVGQARDWYGYADTEDDVKDAIQQVAEAVRDIKESILADAQREWGAKMSTGYGRDGSAAERADEFALLRGDYESHPDVSECRDYFDQTW